MPENPVEYWKHVSAIKTSQNKKYVQKFPLICKLAFALLCLPHGTAGVERVVADMNRLKTKDRNRLNQESMNSALKVRDTYKLKKVGSVYPKEKYLKLRLLQK